MSCKVQQSVCSDCVTYVKSRIKFNTFNTFNNVDSPIISDLHNVWSVLSNVYAKELPDLVYKDIPTIESIENSMEQLISYLPKYSIAMTRKVKL